MPKVTPFRAKKDKAMRAVQAAVKGLPVMDVVEVLTHQLAVAVKTEQGVMDDPREVQAIAAYRGQGRVSEIEKDPELEAFILEQRGYHTIEKLRALCVARFGEDRAPSKSGLHRYIQKRQYRGRGGRHGG